MKFKFYVVAAFLIKSISSLGQSVPAGTELQELVRIGDLYTNTPNLSFSIKVSYADSIAQETILDSTVYTYNLSYGKTYLTNNEMEMLEGGQYSVYVDKEDSLIIVAQGQPNKTVFQIPVMDSVFRNAHISGMSTQDINDTTRKLFMYFNPGSIYRAYNMLYNPQTGIVKSVTYFVNNEDNTFDLPAGHILCIRIELNNYSDTVMDALLFNENRYFYILNGSMYLQPAWQGYLLQN